MVRIGPRVYAGPGAEPWVEEQVVPVVAEFAHLAPTWCHEIEVLFGTGARLGADSHDDDLSGFTLRVEPRMRYHRALLFVGGQWFENPLAYRRRCVVHEIGHLYFAALGALVEQIVESATEEDTILQSVLEWQRIEAEEFGVEDFTELVCHLTGVE